MLEAGLACIWNSRKAGGDILCQVTFAPSVGFNGTSDFRTSSMRRQHHSQTKNGADGNARSHVAIKGNSSMAHCKSPHKKSIK